MTIEARTVNLDVGPLSGPRPAAPALLPEPPAAFIRSPSCSCDPCECGGRLQAPPAAPRIQTQPLYLTRATRHREGKHTFRGVLRMRCVGGCQ